MEKQIGNDWTAEDGAIKSYNDGVKLAVEVGDNGTRELMESILKDEESHIDVIEEHKDQISQMGIQLFLSNQSKD